MGLFLFAMIYTLVITFLVIGFGLLMMLRTPKEINSVYGYRSRMSGICGDTWDFANRYAGKLLLYSGIGTLVFSFILIIVFKNAESFPYVVLALIFIQLIPVFVVVLLTEIALKQKFDEHGRNRQERPSTEQPSTEQPSTEQPS
jgi:uncharacterized membrane protein